MARLVSGGAPPSSRALRVSFGNGLRPLLSVGASAPPPVRNQGPGGSLPGPGAGHPLQRAGHYHASGAKLMAGSLMQYVMVAIVAAGLSLVCGQIWLRRRRVTPLRREIRARDITIRAALDRVYVIEPGMSPGSDFEVPISSPVELIIRGDAFEVFAEAYLATQKLMGAEAVLARRPSSDCRAAGLLPAGPGPGRGRRLQDMGPSIQRLSVEVPHRPTGTDVAGTIHLHGSDRSGR